MQKPGRSRSPHKRVIHSDPNIRYRGPPPLSCGPRFSDMCTVEKRVNLINCTCMNVSSVDGDSLLRSTPIDVIEGRRRDFWNCQCQFFGKHGAVLPGRHTLPIALPFVDVVISCLVRRHQCGLGQARGTENVQCHRFLSAKLKLATQA